MCEDVVKESPEQEGRGFRKEKTVVRELNALVQRFHNYVNIKGEVTKLLNLTKKLHW